MATTRWARIGLVSHAANHSTSSQPMATRNIKLINVLRCSGYLNHPLFVGSVWARGGYNHPRTGGVLYGRRRPFFLLLSMAL